MPDLRAKKTRVDEGFRDHWVTEPVNESYKTISRWKR